MKSLATFTSELEKKQVLPINQIAKIKGGDDKRPPRPIGGGTNPPPMPNGGIVLTFLGFDFI
jgi:hypothetical protein